MLDLFGLKKDILDNPALIKIERPPPRKFGGQKLWAALLVLDSVLVIVFGGAMAAKLYQHVQAPAVEAAAQTGRRKSGKPPAPAEAESPAAPRSAERSPAKDEGAKPAEAQPAQPPKANGPKSAKPALMAEPPQGRQAPKPQAAAKAEEPAKIHAVPAEFKLNAPRAKSAHVAGAFIVRGGRKEMVRHGDGTWTLTLHLLPATKYRYWFIVDGKKITDPNNPKTERGASVLSLP